MSEQPERPKHLELRASDEDRERIAKILHDALAQGRLSIHELDERLQSVYGAKTLGDLVPLTADLPVTGAANAPVTVGSAAPATRIGGTPGPTVSVGVMSGFQHEGDWVVPRYHTALAIMGGGKLDLTQARFAEQTATFQVVAIMGGIEIVVPDDVTVRVNGFGLMGGFDNKAKGDGAPGGPVLVVNGFALMGGVTVRRPRRRQRQVEG